MQRSKLTSVILIILLAVWFIGGYFRKHLSHEESIPAQTPLARVKVMNSEAKIHPVYLTLRGITKADIKVILRAETDSPVIAILENKGSQVKQGQTILKLALNDRPAQLAQAKANVASKEIEYNAAQKLFKRNFTPKTSLANAKTNLEQSKAQLSTIETSIKNTDIRAPFSGIVDGQKVELGQFVKSGDELVTLVKLDPIKSIFPVSEEKVGLVKIGQKSKIKTINGEPFEGMVTYISRVADPATRTYPVELSSKNENYAIPDGMTVEAFIPVTETKAHFISPSVLSLDESGKIGLKVADAKKVAHFMPVEIIDTDTNGVWIQGIPEKSQIIVTGQEFIKDGEKVEIVEGQSSQ